MNFEQAKKHVITLYYSKQYDNSLDFAAKFYIQFKDKYFLNLAIRIFSARKTPNKNIIKYLKNILKDKNDDPKILNKIAYYYFLDNKLSTSIKYYKQVWELEPYSLLANYNLANSYHSKKDFKNAIKYYNFALKIDNEHLDSLNNLGVIYYKKYKKYKTAEKYFRLVLSLKDDNPEALHHLGIIQREFYKDLDLAQKYLNKATIIDRGYIYNHYQLALTYKALGNKEKFNEKIQDCLKINPNDKYVLKLAKSFA